MAKNFMSNEDATSVLTGYANAIKSKQKKTLSSAIVIKGVSYTTVEATIKAIADAIGGDEVVIEIYANTATGSTVKAYKDGAEYTGTETETSGEYKIVVPDYGTYFIMAEKSGDYDAISYTIPKPSVTIPEFDATIIITTDEDAEVTVEVSGVIIDTFTSDGTAHTTHTPGAGTYTVTAELNGNTAVKSIVITTNGQIENIKISTIAIVLSLGSTYSFGGYDWTCAEEIDGGYVLQSQGVTGGTWPGYKMTGPTGSTGNPWGNANKAYTSDIDGANISGYDSTMTTLYNAIEDAEKTNVTYGSGLFLVSKEKANIYSSGQQGSGNYYLGVKIAANNYNSFGASDHYSWIGSAGNSGAFSVSSSGTAYDETQTRSFVISPAFNLDATKVTLDGNTITVNA